MEEGETRFAGFQNCAGITNTDTNKEESHGREEKWASSERTAMPPEETLREKTLSSRDPHAIRRVEFDACHFRRQLDIPQPGFVAGHSIKLKPVTVVEATL